ncbi:hypothetical protein JNK13_11945 [bacterium]|nr:hypothetical protein [bacterium]
MIGSILVKSFMLGLAGLLLAVALITLINFKHLRDCEKIYARIVYRRRRTQKRRRRLATHPTSHRIRRVRELRELAQG